MPASLSGPQGATPQAPVPPAVRRRPIAYTTFDGLSTPERTKTRQKPPACAPLHERPPPHTSRLPLLAPVSRAATISRKRTPVSRASSCVARARRLELPTFGSTVRCSCQLSYAPSGSVHNQSTGAGIVCQENIPSHCSTMASTLPEWAGSGRSTVGCHYGCVRGALPVA